MTNLLIESVQKLLAGSSAGEASSFVFLAAEVTQVQQTFCGTGPGHAHTVEHLDQFRSQFNHTANSLLVSQEVAAVDSIVKMLVNGVVLTFSVHAGVNAALCTNGMRTLNRAKGEEIDFATGFADLHSGHQARKAAANNNNFLFH